MAERRGVAILPPVDVSALVASVRSGSLPIVFYLAENGHGHFSPLLGMDQRRLILPFDDQEGLPVTKFRKAWAAPGICRQAVVADAE